MPWFAWFYVGWVLACCAGIALCVWDIHHITRRMRRG